MKGISSRVQDTFYKVHCISTYCKYKVLVVGYKVLLTVARYKVTDISKYCKYKVLVVRYKVL